MVKSKVEKIIPIINTAINELQLKGVDPLLINLTRSDYDMLISEIKLYNRIGKDYVDGEIKNLQFYKGIEIDCRLPDLVEVCNPLLADSYIVSSTTYEKHNKNQTRKKRLFNLKSLKEIF